MASEVIIEDRSVLFSFRGRIRRATFWDGWAACALLCVLFSVILLGLWIVTAPPATSSEPAASSAVVIPSQLWLVGGVLACLPLWIWLSVCAKRWHDLGLPAAMIVLNMLPAVALVFVKSHPARAAVAGGALALVLMLWLGLAKGVEGPNKFGAKAL